MTLQEAVWGEINPEHYLDLFQTWDYDMAINIISDAIYFVALPYFHYRWDKAIDYAYRVAHRFCQVYGFLPEWAVL